MSGWNTLSELLYRELIQSREEGKDPSALDALHAELARAGTDKAALATLHARLVALPVRADFAFQEPDDLASIRALRRDSRTFAAPVLDAAFEDRMHGAWLGRCVGCALGKPVELLGICAPKAERQYTWRDIKAYLTAVSPDEWPIRDYIPGSSPASNELTRIANSASVRENIAFMETDDDIRYTVLGQVILANKGAAFTTENVAEAWLGTLPYQAVCTAETQAYRNLVTRYDIHESTRWQLGPLPIDWHWVATHLNPYREWIGAQIRVDSYGYGAPGDPALAADFAWRDARLSHVKNGLYGAMFCAALIASAFATEDVHEIVATALGEIPATSRLHAELTDIVALCASHGNRFDAHEAVFNGLCERLGHYSNIHTNNNAAVCVVALLLSGGVFHQAVTLAVMAGFDTDCNGATVGSVVGAIAGAKRIPAHWTGRLNDTLNSNIPGYHPIAISQCAQRAVDIVRKLRA